MAFISNASGFTLGEGTFNNVHGDLVIYQSGKRRREDNEDHCGERMGNRRRKEDQDRLKIIRNKNLSLAFEIGRGPGYLLHAGKIKGRAVVVKVFDAGRNAREHLDATVLLSQGLLHPNVLRIEGISSPTSLYHFIAYEDAQRRTAEGPLAAALRDDLDASIELGFKMISSLSSGIHYLNTQGIPFPLGPKNFDVFLDINDRFLFSINPPTDANPAHSEENDTRSVWTLFNGLCQKVLRSANRVLHDEDIERTPTAFDSSRRLPEMSRPSPGPSLDQPILPTEEAIPSEHKKAPSVPPRREFVWRTMDVAQSLATIATRIARDLDLRRGSINRLARSDGGSIHRCLGYVREEVTLATRTADSAVVSHDAPTIQEVCSVCHEVVNSGEVFRCVCGQEEPGSRPTVKCRSCKTWSHRDCGPTRNESICYFCSSSSSDVTSGAEDLFVHEQDGEAASATQTILSSLDPTFPRRPATPEFSSPHSVPDRVLILVTADSERYVNVDISNASNPAWIRESVFVKFNIFDDEDQRQFAIYRTEIGSFAIGEALTDEKLFKLCCELGDDRGTLKLLVSISSARVHEPSPPLHPVTSLSPINGSTILPPFIPSNTFPPLQPKRSRSRNDSASSTSKNLVSDASVGYEADYERDPSPPSRPPPPPRPLYDRNGNLVPPPPPPPPLSPNRATFEDNNLTPPGTQIHVPDVPPEKSPGEQSEQWRNHYSHAGPGAKVDTSRRNRPSQHHSDAEDSPAESWVMVNGDGEPHPSTPLDSHHSPSSTTRARRQLSPASRFRPTSPYTGRPLAIPAPLRYPPPPVPVIPPDPRVVAPVFRTAGHPVPVNWPVTYKGPDRPEQKPMPTSSLQWRRLTKNAKSTMSPNSRYQLSVQTSGFGSSLDSDYGSLPRAPSPTHP